MLQKKALGIKADTAKSSSVQLEPCISKLQQEITECNNMVSQAPKKEADIVVGVDCTHPHHDSLSCNRFQVASLQSNHHTDNLSQC